MTGTAPTMPAAVQHGVGEVVVEERPVPEVGPTDVLVEVAYCGICGSDLHFVLEGWSAGGIHGHEYSGVIAAVGSEVRDWKVGDEVVGGPDLRCGECQMCRTGRPSLCADRDTPGKTAYQGAFATYKQLPADQLVPVPAGVTLRDAALAEPLAIALHAVTRSGLRAGQSVLIAGAGPIGALILALARRSGAPSITVVEPAESRRELARALGADRLCLPSDLDTPNIAEPERIVADAVDVVFECSGRREAMEAGLGQLVRGGTLVLVGAGIDPPRFDPNRILLNELLVTGAFNYDDGGFEEALAVLASGDLPTAALIDPSDTPLDGILDTMRRLASGDIAGKAMVRPSHPIETRPR